MGLAAVFDDGQLVTFGDAADGGHVCSVAVEMHRHDRPGLRRHGCGARSRIDRQRVGLDVNDSRDGSAGDDRESRECRRHRGNDYFVARSDVERAQRERDTVGAVADANGEWRTAGRRELGLERFDLWTEDEPTGFDDTRNRGCHLCSVFTATEIGERKWGRVVHDTATGDPLGT